MCEGDSIPVTSDTVWFGGDTDNSMRMGYCLNWTVSRMVEMLVSRRYASLLISHQTPFDFERLIGYCSVGDHYRLI
jgi:hypothetical protein